MLGIVIMIMGRYLMFEYLDLQDSKTPVTILALRGPNGKAGLNPVIRRPHSERLALAIHTYISIHIYIETEENFLFEHAPDSSRRMAI